MPDINKPSVSERNPEVFNQAKLPLISMGVLSE